MNLWLGHTLFSLYFSIRALSIEEKVNQALDCWKTANETLSPDSMIDQLIRVLTMTGLYYLTNKVKALKLCSRIVKF